MAGRCLALVAGPAGAGKSTLARVLAPEIERAVVLDKDTLTGPLVSRLLEALGGEPDDRESPLYQTHVRPHEYAALLDSAFGNLQDGTTVLAVAPFAAQLSDPAWLARLHGRLVTHVTGVCLLWATAPVASLAQRIRSRGEPRDTWKLANWEAYARRTALDPPAGLPAWLPVFPIRTDVPADIRAIAHFVRDAGSMPVSMP